VHIGAHLQPHQDHTHCGASGRQLVFISFLVELYLRNCFDPVFLVLYRRRDGVDMSTLTRVCGSSMLHSYTCVGNLVHTCGHTGITLVVGPLVDSPFLCRL
jgi:hypothetical protein